ncbi:glycosyl hydrolase family 28-related protein [Luteococcus sp. Sow4_B9]|uniref:glycosyl hydrolase family 28-related protein n=1 Tax=Luteococcus sp. Sow4_B9 TaxID=3438792 RepID=UPI003F98562F
MTPDLPAPDASATGHRSEATLQPWTDVRAHGATGDGITDDTAAIQRAIDAADDGGTIYFPLGTYRVSAPLQGRPQQTFRGSGATSGVSSGTVRGAQISATHSSPILKLAPCSNVRELRLVGPGDQVGGSIGIDATNASAVVLDDVTIWQTELALTMSKCWYAHVNHCNFWRNQTAIRLEYCYNVGLYDIRISGLLADGSSNGRGIEMIDRSLVSIHGGAIEQYSTGISLSDSMMVSLFGVYMETRTVGSRGIHATGSGPQVLATGCQVYVMNHQAWLDISESHGGLVTASGNRFKGGVQGQATTAYAWQPDRNQRARVTGDSWHDVRKDRAIQHHSTPLPSGSLVELPSGAPGAPEDPVVASTLNIGGLGKSWTSTGAGWARPRPGAEEVAIGAQFFDTRLGHPIWWTGSVWVDALGQPVDGAASRMATQLQTAARPLVSAGSDGLRGILRRARTALRR